MTLYRVITSEIQSGPPDARRGESEVVEAASAPMSLTDALWLWHRQTETVRRRGLRVKVVAVPEVETVFAPVRRALTLAGV